MRHLLSLGLAAALAIVPAGTCFARSVAIPPSPQYLESFNCRDFSAPGICQIGEGDYIVDDDIFLVVRNIYAEAISDESQFSENSVGYYNIETTAHSVRSDVFMSLGRMGYGDKEAACLSRIVTEGGNAIMSEGWYHDGLLFHERMHRRISKLGDEEKSVLRKAWQDAAKKREESNGNLLLLDFPAGNQSIAIRNSDGSEHAIDYECDEYWMSARGYMDHFYIYLCLGVLPESESALENNSKAERIFLEKICVD